MLLTLILDVNSLSHGLSLFQKGKSGKNDALKLEANEKVCTGLLSLARTYWMRTKNNVKNAHIIRYFYSLICFLHL